MPSEAIPAEIAHPASSMKNPLPRLFRYRGSFEALWVLLTVMSLKSYGNRLICCGRRVMAVGLVVLAFAQIEAFTLCFSRHHYAAGLTTTNNIVAPTYGAWIVSLVITGSCWIMFNLSANML